VPDDAVSVANVGREGSGTYLDVRCGDAPVEVGQSLWIEQGGRHLSVIVDRIDFYGHDRRVLDAGHTARIWVSPCEVASLLASGMCLKLGGRPTR
jgi:hypothetical protein